MPPPLHIIHRDVDRFWGAACVINILPMANGSFCFQFLNDTESDYLRVFALGAWSLGGRPLKLIQWRKHFRPLCEEITSCPVWIRLEGLPLYFWEEDILWMIAAEFGGPVQIDDFTLSRSRSQYARVCIELDLTAPLKTGTLIGSSDDDLFTQLVSYENLPAICYHCARLGHSFKYCPDRHISDVVSGSGDLVHGVDPPGEAGGSPVLPSSLTLMDRAFEELSRAHLSEEVPNDDIMEEQPDFKGQKPKKVRTREHFESPLVE